MIQICENLARILCHASLLKCDDIRLKSLPPGSRACSLCDLFAVEDASHVIMQCPGTQQLRYDIFEELESHQGIKDVFVSNKNDVMLICLGKCPDDNYNNGMVKLWCISSRHINGIYKYILKQRKAVGLSITVFV